MERIICPKCYTEITDGSSTCPKCGAVLPSTGGGISLSNSYSGGGEKPNQVNQQHVAQAILNENKTQTSPKAALAIGVIFVIIVVAIILVLFFGSSGGGSSNESSDSGIGTAASSTASSEDNQSSAESSASSDAVAVEDSSGASTTENSEPASQDSNVRTITVEKPDEWSDIYCYAYTKSEDNMQKNSEFPGEAMTESDGKYTYQIPENFGDEECYVIFSTTSTSDGYTAQYPYYGEDGFAVSEKSDYTLSDFTAYADAFEPLN